MGRTVVSSVCECWSCGRRRCSYQMPRESRSGRFRQRCRHTVGEGGPYILYTGCNRQERRGQKLHDLPPILVVTSDHVRRPFSSLAPKRKRELTLGETGGKDEQEGGKPHGRCSLLELSLSLQRQSKGLSAATVAS